MVPEVQGFFSTTGGLFWGDAGVGGVFSLEKYRCWRCILKQQKKMFATNHFTFCNCLLFTFVSL